MIPTPIFRIIPAETDTSGENPKSGLIYDSIDPTMMGSEAHFHQNVKLQQLWIPDWMGSVVPVMEEVQQAYEEVGQWIDIIFVPF